MGNVDIPNVTGGLLGSSSSASFMRQIRTAIGLHKKAPGGSKSNAISHTLPRLPRGNSQTDGPHEAYLILPPRKSADHLFRLFWEYSDPIFPVLDKEFMLEQYAALWDPTRRVEINKQLFFCSLNLIFALASELDPGEKPQAQTKSADMYYQRAKKLMSFDMLDVSYFDIIQALLLAAQYLQSTKMPTQCFRSVGLATWIAMDLGLHIPNVTASFSNVGDRELARRVWHACILLDK